MCSLSREGAGATYGEVVVATDEEGVDETHVEHAMEEQMLKMEWMKHLLGMV